MIDVCLYFAAAVLSVIATRKTTERLFGFNAFLAITFIFLAWPLSLFARLVFFVFEGNLWEDA